MRGKKILAFRNGSVSLRAVLKRFALLFLPLVTVLSIVLILGIQFNEQQELEEVKLRENNQISVVRLQILKTFDAIDSDLHLIANLPALRHYLDDKDSGARDDLIEFMLALSKGKGHYDKLLFLDLSGREVIGVNYNNGNPVLVPNDQLQDKSGRYFFRDTLSLGMGEEYASPLDLNVENNQLEMPYKPTIRFGLPVFDSAGRKQGVFLLSYRANDMLLDFSAGMAGEGHQAMLLNSDGYWLSSRNPADEWGFMLDKRELTFGRRFANEWRTLSVNDEGVLKTADGLFVYRTVRPLRPEYRPGSGALSGSSALLPEEYAWKMVSFTPQEVLQGAFFYRQPGSLVLIVTIYLLLALLVLGITFVTLQSRRSELFAKQFGRLLQGSFNEIYLFDAKTLKFIQVSEGATVNLGYSARELRQLTPLDLKPGFTREGFEEMIAPLRSGEKSMLFFETLHRRKDGSNYPVEVHLELVRDEQPEFLAIIQDITERKKAEEALRLSALKHHLLFQSSRDALLTAAAPSWKFSGANAATVQMFGAENEEQFVTLGPWDVSPEKQPDGRFSAEKIQEIIAAVLREGSYFFEWVHQRLDGHTFPADVLLTRMELGGELFLQGSVRDITERKKSEEALRLSALKHRLLFQSSRDALMTLAPPSWKFTSANAATVQMFGAENEVQFVTLGPWNVSPEVQPDGRFSSDKAQEMIATALREGSHFFEWEHQRLDGQSFPADVLLTRMELGDELFLQATVRNVTRRKQAQLELEKAGRYKDEFLAAISHELRTPLHQILGFSDMLREDMVGSLNAEQRGVAQDIYDAGNRLLAIVNSLIRLAGLQTGKMLLHAGTEDAARVVNGIATRYADKARAAGLVYDIEVQQNIGEMQLDCEVVTHIIEQLLSNAFKFTPAGGKVSLVARRVPRSAVSVPVRIEVQEYLELAVADNGPEIPPDILPRLFYPFVQGEGGLNRSYQGAGIGLALVRLLSELHGGGVSVESQYDQGAKFLVWLPISAK